MLLFRHLNSKTKWYEYIFNEKGKYRNIWQWCFEDGEGNVAMCEEEEMTLKIGKQPLVVWVP